MARLIFIFIIFIFTQSATASENPSQEVYIQDRNSGLSLQYNPQATYEVTIERRTTSSRQKWLLTDAGVAGYVYIQSAYNNRYVTAGTNREDPLYLSDKKGDLDLTQVWILREPDSGTNRNFILMSARTGMVMDVFKKNQNPGTRIIIYNRSNGNWQQFSFHA